MMNEEEEKEEEGKKKKEKKNKKNKRCDRFTKTGFNLNTNNSTKEPSGEERRTLKGCMSVCGE